MAEKKSANSERFSWAQDGGKLLKKYSSECQSDNIFLDSLESTETVLYWILEFGYVKVKKSNIAPLGCIAKW